MNYGKDHYGKGYPDNNPYQRYIRSNESSDYDPHRPYKAKDYGRPEKKPEDNAHEKRAIVTSSGAETREKREMVQKAACWDELISTLKACEEANYDIEDTAEALYFMVRSLLSGDE